MRVIQKLGYLIQQGRFGRAAWKVGWRTRTEAERRLPILRRGPEFSCPCCGYLGLFLTFRGRAYSECPGCRSKERHRLLRLVLDEVLGGRTAWRILHVAPERVLQHWLRNRSCYFATDLARGFNRSDYHLSFASDLTRLPLADRVFDLVIASHVLEHILEDACAIREIYRVLLPGGTALLPVPVTAGEKTVEFGAARVEQEEHVRAPGMDYFERYRQAGFEVQLRSSHDYAEKHQPFCCEGGKRGLEYVPICRVPN